jgi:hypothetical protein
MSAEAKGQRKRNDGYAAANMPNGSSSSGDGAADDGNGNGGDDDDGDDDDDVWEDDDDDGDDDGDEEEEEGRIKDESNGVAAAAGATSQTSTVNTSNNSTGNSLSLHSVNGTPLSGLAPALCGGVFPEDVVTLKKRSVCRMLCCRFVFYAMSADLTEQTKHHHDTLMQKRLKFKKKH